MRRIIAVALCAGIGSAFAATEATPTGDWLVAEGTASIRIADCGGALWGVISWEKVPGGTDSENPDPAKKGRPTLGLPILLAMKPTKPNRWEGSVYNAKNGKTYSASIILEKPDVLRIEGCLLTNFLCGGENWTRVKHAAPAAKTTNQAVRPQPGAKPTGARMPSSAMAAASVEDVCSSVSESPGTTH
jgi:uncharacterized protein (DUF2147 family)